MSGLFDRAVQYKADAVCLTPLRSGAGEEEEVLRDGSGRVFLQGTSIAGAMRAWAAEVLGQEEAGEVFGNQQQFSRLIVSDGLFRSDTDVVIRSRVRINGATGSVEDGAKFDVAHAATGSRLTFTLTWLGNGGEDQVEQILSAMDRGEIRLGAEKSNGFGRVSLTVLKKVYDLRKEEDRLAWMNDEFKGKKLKLPPLPQKQRVTFEVRADTDQLLVKTGALVQTGDEGSGSYAPHLEENGRPVIPGSSVKGAVLTRARSIAAYLGVPAELTDRAFGRGAIEGDNGLPGQFFFEDAFYEQEKKQKIVRIQIDRFTGSVIRQRLFQEEPVTGRLVLKLSAPRDQQAACGLILLALRDLGLGLYNLGSEGAVGRGVLKNMEIRACCEDKKLKLSFDADRKAALEDGDGLAAAWLGAMEGVRNEQ